MSTNGVSEGTAEKASIAAFPIYENDLSHPAVILKRKLRDLYDFLEETIPASRARSIAITDLENCGMWAVKAIHQGARE